MKKIQTAAKEEDVKSDIASQGSNIRPSALGRNINLQGVGLTGVQPVKKPEEKYGNCSICYSKDSDAAFIPCGHNCACIECARKCEACPVCRVPFDDIMKIYK